MTSFFCFMCLPILFLYDKQVKELIKLKVMNSSCYLENVCIGLTVM